MTTTTRMVCRSCSAEASQWAGRCANCGEWNSIEEHVGGGQARHDRESAGGFQPAVPIAEVDASAVVPTSTGVAELDRVLGGGLVAGSVTLMGGEPGIGKSTLLLQVAAMTAGPALYLTAEESAAQVRQRAERMQVVDASLFLASDTNLDTALRHIDAVKPALVVIDSIQTVFDPQLNSPPGSVTQVRECANRLVNVAKSRGIAIVLVGHVTKEGSLAGPRVLEHLVDTVVSFEGERHGRLRVLRAVKHRFGATTEIGLLEMSDSGLDAVADPSRSFLADRSDSTSGSAVVPIVEGRRPLLVEVQALVAPSALTHPRRYAHGIDANRLNLMLAVLERRVSIQLSKSDVYAMTVGGVRVVDPGADLGVALATASSAADKPLPSDLVVVAEVGLGGELRAVGAMEERIAEAQRLGFRRAIVPASSADIQVPLRLEAFATLADVIAHLGLSPSSQR